MGRGDEQEERDNLLAGFAATESPAERVQLARNALKELFGRVVSAEDWQETLRIAAKFPKYSYTNAQLIHQQNPEARQVMGYHSWLAVGRQVQKGEHGLVILAPRFQAKLKKPRQKGVPLTPEEEAERKSMLPIGFRIIKVFDISQTAGPDLPNINAMHTRSGDVEADLYKSLQPLLAKYDLTGRAHAALNVNMQSCPFLSYKAVLTAPSASTGEKSHAIAHALGHIFLEHARSSEELLPLNECEAESAAYILFTLFGARTDIFSFGAVALWGKGDVKVLEKAGKRAGKAAERMLQESGLS